MLLYASFLTLLILVVSDMSVPMETSIDDTSSLKEELRLLQAELYKIGEEEAAVRAQYIELYETTLTSEYQSVLDSLSAPPRKRPFPGLLGSQTQETAPDAFLFMSLMQASAADEIALKAVCRKLPFVHNLSAHHAEELLQIVPRTPSNGTARGEFLRALIFRFQQEILAGSWTRTGSLFSAVAVVLQAELELAGSPVKSIPDNFCIPFKLLAEVIDILAKEAYSKLGTWPATQQSEVALLIGTVAGSVDHEAVSRDESLPASFLPGCAYYLSHLLNWLQTNSYNEELYSPKVIWQILGALRKGRLPVSANLASQLTVSAERAISKPLVGSTRSSTDLHLMAIELAAIRARGTGSLWSTLVEKLAHGSPAIFEVSGTLTACVGMGYTHDQLMSNMVAFKRFLSRATPAEFSEIAETMAICGEKNVATLRSLFDRKEYLEIPQVAWAIVGACAVYAANEGNAIPDSIIALKKTDTDGNSQFISAERKQLIYVGLQPGGAQQQAIPELNRKQSVASEKLNALLTLLGYTDAELSYVSEGLVIDVAFPAHRIAILVESEALYNVSHKRHQARGWTTLKGFALNRKGWKVVTFVPESFQDEKAMISYMTENLKKIPYSATLKLATIDDAKKLNVGQRLRNLVIRDLSLVDIAKVLLHMLRSNITVDVLDIADCGLSDYATEVICEFVLTYLTKYPLSRLDVSYNCLSDSFLQRLLHSLKSLTGANRSLEVVLIGNRLESAMPPLADPVKVVIGENTGAAETGTTVYLIGMPRN